MPTVVTLGIGFALEAGSLLMPPTVWAMFLSVLSLSCFAWVAFDYLRGIKIIRINGMPESVTSADFNTNAKFLILGLAMILGLTTVAGGFGARYFYDKWIDTRKDLGFVFQMMPNLPNLGIKVNGERIVHHYGENFKRVLMVCRAQDHQVDVLDDTRIEKSREFDLKADEMTMEITLSPQLLQRAATLTTLVECQLVLLKDSMGRERISSLRQVQDSGGMLAGRFGHNLSAGM